MNYFSWVSLLGVVYLHIFVYLVYLVGVWLGSLNVQIYCSNQFHVQKELCIKTTHVTEQSGLNIEGIWIFKDMYSNTVVTAAWIYPKCMNHFSVHAILTCFRCNTEISFSQMFNTCEASYFNKIALDSIHDFQVKATVNMQPSCVHKFLSSAKCIVKISHLNVRTILGNKHSNWGGLKISADGKMSRALYSCCVIFYVCFCVAPAETLTAVDQLLFERLNGQEIYI